MSVREIHGIPALRERPPGFASTDITNEQTRAINTITPSIVIGQVDEPPLGGSSAPMKYVQVASTWTSGNTISGPQVASQTDSTPTGVGTVVVDINSPNGGGAPVNVIAVAGTIIAYHEYIDQTQTSKGIVANVAQGVNASLGTLKYQVFQMTSNTSAGWDWVRAHG